MRHALCCFALALGGAPYVICSPEGVSATAYQLPSAQSSQKPRRTVAGTVVNAITNEPVRRALVRINGPEQRVAFTGPDGHFQIDNVLEGPAYFAVQKPGFFEASTAAGPLAAPQFVTIGPGTADLVLKLTPQAEVHGRVVDADGEPVENVGIQLIQQNIVNGRKQWQPSGGATTNENGLYRVENLPPGQYVIHSGSRPVFPGYVNAEADTGLVPQVYPPQFYPNAPDLSSAQPVEVKPGEQAEADFTLSPARCFTVRGTVSGAPNGFFIECLDSDGEQLPCMSRGNPRTNSFVISQLPAGSLTIRFRSNNGQGHSFFAEEALTLNKSDVSGLKVQLQSLASIPVHIVNGPDRPNIQVQLIAGKQWRNGAFGAFAQPGDPPGTLAFHDVPPGVYTFSAQPVGGGCIESITSGNTDLLRNDLTVSSGSAPAPIEVTLFEHCATIAGSVTANAQPMNGFIVLVPELPSVQPTVMPVQAGAKFKFGNLSPGSYRLYALSDIAGVEYANPEAMREFPSQQIELTAGQQAQVDMELTSRGER